MKKLMMVLAILVAFTATAAAQVPSPFSVYAGGAFSMPTGPDTFKAAYKTGYHGSVGVGYKMAPQLQLVGKVEYHTFAFDWANSVTPTGYSGWTNKMWMYGADAKFSPNVPAFPVAPYLLGGVGMASISSSEASGPTALITASLNSMVMETINKMYFNVGAGFDLKSGPGFGLFAQVRYVSIATDDEASTFIPVTIGVKFM